VYRSERRKRLGITIPISRAQHQQYSKHHPRSTRARDEESSGGVNLRSEPMCRSSVVEGGSAEHEDQKRNTGDP